MLDLEESVSRVWNPDVRPLVTEAYRSYTTGSARACIILTWGAVTSDLIDKLRRLGEDGEGVATAVVRKIEVAREQNDVRGMQEVESSLLSTARDLELLDFVEERELQRLREDRHLCAHPSLRPFGDFYTPTLEYARAHLAAAVEALLIHPPSQGRKVVDRFTTHVADPAFTGSREFLTHTFFDQVKPTVRRKIVDVAVRVACLEPDGLPDPPGAEEVADRMADCLHLFAARDRKLVAQFMAKATERLGGRPRSVQIRSVGRLGGLDVFWGAVAEPLKGQIEGLIGGIATERDAALTADEYRLLSLVGIDEVRRAMPVLESAFTALEGARQATVISLRPGKYFTSYLPNVLDSDASHSFRIAEIMTRFAVLPCAPYLGVSELDATLVAWTGNDQCLMASEMPQNAVALYQATQHLRPNDQSIWRDFINRVRGRVPEDNPYYRYNELATAIGM